MTGTLFAWNQKESHPAAGQSRGASETKEPRPRIESKKTAITTWTNPKLVETAPFVPAQPEPVPVAVTPSAAAAESFSTWTNPKLVSEPVRRSHTVTNKGTKTALQHSKATPVVKMPVMRAKITPPAPDVPKAVKPKVVTPPPKAKAAPPKPKPQFGAFAALVVVSWETGQMTSACLISSSRRVMRSTAPVRSRTSSITMLLQRPLLHQLRVLPHPNKTGHLYQRRFAMMQKRRLTICLPCASEDISFLQIPPPSVREVPRGCLPVPPPAQPVTPVPDKSQKHAEQQEVVTEDAGTEAAQSVGPSIPAPLVAQAAVEDVAEKIHTVPLDAPAAAASAESVEASSTTGADTTSEAPSAGKPKIESTAVTTTATHATLPSTHPAWPNPLFPSTDFSSTAPLGLPNTLLLHQADLLTPKAQYTTMQPVYPMQYYDQSYFAPAVLPGWGQTFQQPYIQPAFAPPFGQHVYGLDPRMDGGTTGFGAIGARPTWSYNGNPAPRSRTSGQPSYHNANRDAPSQFMPAPKP